ncbi:NPCBM/NEW2 domain-containing protein [Thermoactinospora rubra]|uniref:NPCBM/NEW2 domain-containing protein n=1 Tax=Thermoactinospora rubra TaxID=1088767 RepID=UPI001301C747|nr:NPCBM/NEW2 domain-containing protein [Thermoactinospora rubra]
MRATLAALAAALLLPPLLPLPAEAARTAAPPGVTAPPMGWSSRSLGCSVSEAAVRQAADRLAAAFSAYGYRYVIVDGCWLAPQRSGGALAADPARFPSGIPALAEYVHGKGLKLGLALSAGTKACAGGGPGSYGHEAADGAQVAAWGVDYVRYDWCNVPMADFPGKDSRAVAQTLYPLMRQALGDSIAFAMNNEDGNSVPWLWGAELATTWRTNLVTRPIGDTYAGMVDIWEVNQLRAEHARPGSWADPDLLQAGRGGMTELEYRTQMTLWAVGAAPLILQSLDAPPSVVADPEVIAVDQDPLGAMGRLVKTDGWYHVLAKPLQDGSQAIVLFNESDRAATLSWELPEGRYRVEDLWTGAVATTRGALAAHVPAHGAVMYRVGESREQAPPLVTVEVDPSVPGDDRPSALEPGRENPIVTRVVNTGATATLRDVEVTLAVPEGWRARADGERATRRLAPGEDLTVTWAVTPPAGAEQKAYDLVADVRAGTGRWSGAAVVRVAAAPGPGTSYLSDLTWTNARNHLGPPKRDTSHDGRPLTLDGVAYAKGLGAHAPADIEYYLARRCSTVEFVAGVDDEVGANGSVTFEVWADGERTARTGLITGAQPARKVTASVEGARYVRLVVANGGDNAYFDHADLADATVTCR